jgi:hypothetical protein
MHPPFSPAQSSDHPAMPGKKYSLVEWRHSPECRYGGVAANWRSPHFLAVTLPPDEDSYHGWFRYESSCFLSS